MSSLSTSQSIAQVSQQMSLIPVPSLFWLISYDLYSDRNPGVIANMIIRQLIMAGYMDAVWEIFLYAIKFVPVINSGW